MEAKHDARDGQILRNSITEPMMIRELLMQPEVCALQAEPPVEQSTAQVR